MAVELVLPKQRKRNVETTFILFPFSTLNHTKDSFERIF